MVRFAHLADVHLGGWKQPELQKLNFQSFVTAIDICIKQKVDFVLIAGDLFDTAFPGIEILKEAFGVFKKLKESKIPCFLIAGSHDYSVSGKTFLEVLEKAGFCKNVENHENNEETNTITLNPTVYGEVAIYGYPGRRSGLEVPQLRKVKFNDAPGLFKVFMLHTTLDKVKGDLPIDSIEADLLPRADYYALGHIHIDYQYENFVYPGPIFPNNFKELEDLQYGRFCIVDTSDPKSIKKFQIPLKEVVPITVHVTNPATATEVIIREIGSREIEEKIVLLRLKGNLETGKNSDIKFSQIEEFANTKNAYFLLKNTHELKTKEVEMEFDVKDSDDVEEEIIKIYSEENPSDFNKFIQQLISSFAVEKQEGETSENFSKRLLDEAKKILNF